MPNTAVVRALLAAGADVNHAERYGATPLMFAALRNNEDAARELLATKDIDINVSDNQLCPKNTRTLLRAQRLRGPSEGS